MPTYQRRNSLMRTLQQLALVEYPADQLELLLVCDGCTDGSAEMARSLDLPFRVRVLEQSNQGPAAARNLALTHAKGPLVLFLDDDVLPSQGLLAEHARAHLEAPGEDRAVIGALLPPAGAPSPWVRWELATVVRQYKEMEAGDYRPGPRQFYTGNASVPLQHLQVTGGFDIAFQRAEDVELAFRLQARGVRFVFRSEAAGLHTAERSFRSWLNAAYQYGRNDVVLGLDRGRPDMLGVIAREFWQRNPLNRTLMRRGLSANLGIRAGAHAAITVAWLAQCLGYQALSHSLCSALFNTSYWRGVSDQLGGPAAAKQLTRLGAHPAGVDWAAVSELLRPLKGDRANCA